MPFYQAVRKGLDVGFVSAGFYHLKNLARDNKTFRFKFCLAHLIELHSTEPLSLV